MLGSLAEREGAGRLSLGLSLSERPSPPKWPRGNTPTESGVCQSSISFNGIRQELLCGCDGVGKAWNVLRQSKIHKGQ